MDQSLLTSLAKVATSTPLWVWGIFGYLVLIGIKSTKTHIVFLPRLFLIPAVFIGTKYKLFISENYTLIFTYFLLIILGFGIGTFIGNKTSINVLKDIKSIELPGTYSFLIILSCFFSIKYIFGFLYYTNPELASQYSIIEIGVSGLFSGYFLGRALSFLRRFIQA